MQTFIFYNEAVTAAIKHSSKNTYNLKVSTLPSNSINIPYAKIVFALYENLLTILTLCVWCSVVQELTGDSGPILRNLFTLKTEYKRSLTPSFKTK